MYAKLIRIFNSYHEVLLLVGVLVFMSAFALSDLTSRPAYWYDEAINVELARNFADFGKLDLVVAPDTFSGVGPTIGSTGYTITAPLGLFFKAFGFGLAEARVYMLIWMNVFLLSLFVVTKTLWDKYTAAFSTLFIASFAPFYGNGLSVMGEIPGFVFFLWSFYLLTKEKYWWSGLLLGLAVVSKPSIYVFLVFGFLAVFLFKRELWKQKILDLFKVGIASVGALVPWVFIYLDEVLNPLVWTEIVEHFRNPYGDAGFSTMQNIQNNLSSFWGSTTLLYFTVFLALTIVAVFLRKDLFNAHRIFFILGATYIPLAFFQYIRSFGYLRYLIAAEFITFMLFTLSLPALIDFFLKKYQNLPEKSMSIIAGGIFVLLILVQTVHLFKFSDLYSSDKTQRTIQYLDLKYPKEIIGVMNVPHVGSLLSADRKYQYLSTFGLWQFGTNSLLLSKDKLPAVLVLDTKESVQDRDRETLMANYEEDTAFSTGFTVYKRK